MKRILLSVAMMAALSASAQNTRSMIVSTYGENINIENATQQNAKLTRPVYLGYNTICLPYSLTSEEVTAAFGEGVTLEKAVGAVVENGNFELCFADCTGEGIEAGMPYLLHSPKMYYASIKYNGSMSVMSPIAVNFSDGQGNTATFKGSFERLDPVGTWAIPAVLVDGEVPSNLLCCDGSRRLLPTRCFFTWDSTNGTASNLTIKHLAAGETVSGINSASVTDANVTTFNTAGQRVNNAQHGVMIQNGRKVIK